jgi:hypothetical protein
MDLFPELVQKENKSFKTADHFAYVIFPLIKENKILVNINENLYNASSNGIQAFLIHEHLPIHKEFRTNLKNFEDNILKKYKFSNDLIKVIKDIIKINEKHESSTIEFSRQEKYVISNNSYSNMDIIDLKTIKTYIVVLRQFLYTLNTLNHV